MTPPSQIAHYRILSKLGEGGMGAVYRATDNKLNRDVAIKVLPPAFAEDAARMQRFEREAQVLASLNHPNIAAIYGIEQSAIVMELVEGEDLNGPLPVDTVIDYARQVAAGLDAAHERGIVHRDLKPANIKVTPDGVVKLLDFGLAKAREESASTAGAGSPTMSPTLSLAMTQAGMILGTAAYMAPEQARGKPVDRRADIWAFGVILYELLTGAMLFGGGETVSDSLAAVLTREPDYNALPKDTPPRLRKLIERCLRKDPKQRLRDIGDARLLLDEAEPEAPVASAAPPAPRRWAGIAARTATLLAVLLGFGWWRSAHREPELKPLMRLNVDLGPNVLQGAFASAWLSPDGRRLAFLSPQTGGGSALWIRQLDQKDATFLAADASSPFFSPDGQWVGFFSPGKLRKVSVQGGGPVTICDIEGVGDGAWSEDGAIVFSLGSRGLYAVSQDGGTPKRLTDPAARNENSHRLPHFLPGGKAVLFTHRRSAGNWDASDVELLRFQTGERKALAKAAYAAQYLDSGHLVFLRENRLFAVAFDAEKGELQGTPVPVVEGIKALGGGAQLFSAARNGTLVYESGGTQSSWPVVRVDRSGKPTPLVERPARYRSPRFSPDGKSLAASAAGPRGDDLWVFDLERKTSTQLTFNAGLAQEAVWTPDGKYIMFSTNEPAATWLIRGDGAGGARRVSETEIRPQSFTPDGRRIVSTGGGISTYPLDLSDPEHPKVGALEWVIQEPRVHDAEVSPDGRWVAFVLGVMGREELFVVPYRIGGAAGGRWRISAMGAKFPRWSRTASELFFRDPNGRIQVVEYTVKGESFSAGNPRQWSPARILATGVVSNWDLAPDGKRAVAFPLPEGELEEGGSLHITFLLNFSDELRRKAPVKR